MTKGKRTVLLLLITGLGLYLLSCGYVYFNQAQIVYQNTYATGPLARTPHSIGLKFDDLRLTTRDGVQLHGWYVPADAPRATVIYCHGNASNMSSWLDVIHMLRELHLNVVIFDYRGFGQSQGQASEQGTYRDADAVWEYLSSRHQQAPLPVIVYGRSLGGGVATYLAQTYPVSQLILESTFSSVPAAGRDRFPWLPVDTLAHIRYDSLQRMTTIRTPVLIAHSREDQVIAFHHGQALYQQAIAPKQFIQMQGGHNSGYATTPEFRSQLNAFITRFLGSP